MPENTPSYLRYVMDFSEALTDAQIDEDRVLAYRISKKHPVLDEVSEFLTANPNLAHQYEKIGWSCVSMKKKDLIEYERVAHSLQQIGKTENEGTAPQS